MVIMPSICSCGIPYSDTLCKQNSCSMCVSIKRDINHVFKFNVGDRVEKKWRWNKLNQSRCGHIISFGTKGLIKQVNPETGEVCVEFAPGDRSHLGAIELDVLAEFTMLAGDPLPFLPCDKKCGGMQQITIFVPEVEARMS